MDISIVLQVAQLIVIIIGPIIFMAMIKADVKILRNDVVIITKRADNHSEKLNILTDAFTKLAVQDNRIKNLEDDVRELKHGEGFVLPITPVTPKPR